MFRCGKCGNVYSGEEIEHRSIWDRTAYCPYCGSDDAAELLYFKGSPESANLWAWTDECEYRVCEGDCDECHWVNKETEDEDMSVSLWAWHEECDRHACVGDCDNCDYTDEEAEDNEHENTD